MTRPPPRGHTAPAPQGAEPHRPPCVWDATAPCLLRPGFGHETKVRGIFHPFLKREAFCVSTLTFSGRLSGLPAAGRARRPSPAPRGAGLSRRVGVLVQRRAAQAARRRPPWCVISTMRSYCVLALSVRSPACTPPNQQPHESCPRVTWAVPVTTVTSDHSCPRPLVSWAPAPRPRPCYPWSTCSSRSEIPPLKNKNQEKVYEDIYVL